MKKLLLVLTCASMVTINAMQEDKGLYLVAGSTRNNNNKIKNYIVGKLWQEENVDLSHINTYNGKATTIDLSDSILPNVEHKVADLYTHTFKENTIKAAYLERLPTFGVHNMQLVKEEKNYLGTCIQNIGKGMVAGSVIEIEWSPYIRFSQSKEDMEYEEIYAEEKVKESPFSTSLDLGLALTAIDNACSDDAELPENCGAAILGKTIGQLLEFYAKKQVGTLSALKKRLHQELWFMTMFLKTGQKALLSKGPEVSLEDFSQAIKEFPFIMANNDLIGTEMTVSKNGKIFNGILYDIGHFLGESFLNFILCDASIAYNSTYVKEFMLNNGFKDVTIERTTSPHNGRTNVWIVRAVKA